MPNEDLFKYNVDPGKGLPKSVSLDVVPRQEIGAETYKEYQGAIGQKNIPFDQEVLQEMAYQNQTRPELFIKGLGRAGIKVVEEVLSLPGYAAAPFTGWDNVWLQTIKGGAEAFRDVAAPVYMSKAVEEGGIMGKLTDGAWWSTTGADGIGFMASMFVPGAALKAMGAGRLLTGAAGAIGRGAELLGGAAVTAADLTNVGNKISGLGRLAKWGKGIQASAAAESVANSAITVATNTYIEAAAEANSSYLNTRDQLMRANPNMTEEEANRIAGNAAANVFTANLGVLGISNYILERYVFKGFNARASAVNRLKGVNPFARAATEGATAARGVTRGAARVGAEAAEDVVQAGERAAVSEIVGEGVEAAERGAVRAAGELGEETVEGGVKAAARAAKSSKGLKTLDDLKARNFWQKAGRAAIGGFKGAIAEGGWEEGMQTSAEQYFLKQALEGGDLSQPWNIPGNLWNIAKKWTKNVAEMESTEDSRGFYEAAVLGGVLGGGMTTVGDYSEIGEREKILFGTPEVKARETFLGSKRLAKGMDRLTGREPQEASPGLVQDFKAKIEASTVKLEDLLVPKADGTGYETNEDGTYKINEKNLNAISEAGRGLAESMAQLAAYEQALGDKKIDGTISLEETQELEKLKHRREMFLLNQYINMEGGADLFNDHVDEIVDKFIAKQFEDNPTATLNAGERAQERERLKGKVKRLSKLNEVIRNTHINNMGVLMNEPGTPEDKELFSRLRLNEKVSQGAYLDNLDYQIKEKQREITNAQSFGSENTVDQAVAEARNKELEILQEQKKEQQQVYQDLFNEGKIKESYAKFLGKKEEFEELQKEMQRIFEEFQSPDYVKNLFEKEGYDYENDTDIRIDIVDDNGNIERSLDVEKNNNGERVLVYTDEVGNKFYLKKEGEDFFLSPYNGTQSTPREVEEEFYQTRKGSIRIEGKDKREERIKEEEGKFVEKQKEAFTDAVEDMVDSMIERKTEIQKEIDKLTELQNKLKERDTMIEKVKDLERKLKNSLKSKKEAKAKEKLNEAKKILEEMSGIVDNLLSATNDDINTVDKINDRIKQLQEDQKSIDRKIEKILAQKQNIENIANKQDAKSYRDFVVKQLIKDAFEQENFSDKDLEFLESRLKVLPDALSGFIQKLEDSTEGNFERMFGEAFGKTKDLKTKLEESKVKLEETKKEIEGLLERIKLLEARIELARKGMENKSMSKKSRQINKELKEKEEAVLKEEQLALDKANKKLIELEQTIKELEQKESDINTARQELFNKLVELKQMLDIPIQIEQQLGKLNENKAKEAKKQEPVNAIEDKDRPAVIEEERKNRRVPNSPFVLTGIDVLMEGGKDKLDENGNVVLNSNPYARNWFDFTLDIIMNKENMNDYEFVVTSLNAENLDPEIKTQIEDSFRSNPELTQEQRNNALFVFVKKKRANNKGSYFYQKDKKYVFTSMRSMENIASKFELNAASREAIRRTMSEENRNNFDKATEEEKQQMLDAIKQKMIEDYRQTLENLRETLKTKSQVGVKLFNSPDVRHLNFKFENGEQVKNKVKDVFPFLFSQLGVYPKIRVETNEYVEVKNSKGGTTKIYRIPVGMPFIDVQGIPVILHQNKLNDNMIDTVIALYSEFAGKKGLEQEINGVRILGQKNQGLLGALVSYGTGKNNNSAVLYIKNKKLFYGLKRDSRQISLDLLKKYTEGKEQLTKEETEEINALKDYLGSRYININKEFLNLRAVSIPVFNKETRKIELKDVNYNNFILEKVATIPLDKDRPFVQVNFAIDRNSLSKKLVDIKAEAAPNSTYDSISKDILITDTAQVVDYMNNKLEKELNRLFRNKKDLQKINERTEAIGVGQSYDGVRNYLLVSLKKKTTKDDMLKALDGIARTYILAKNKEGSAIPTKIKIAAMLLYVDRVREFLSKNEMPQGAKEIQNAINEPRNMSEEEDKNIDWNNLPEGATNLPEAKISVSELETSSEEEQETKVKETEKPVSKATQVKTEKEEQIYFAEKYPKEKEESEIDYLNRLTKTIVEENMSKIKEIVKSEGLEKMMEFLVNNYFTLQEIKLIKENSNVQELSDFHYQIKTEGLGFVSLENNILKFKVVKKDENGKNVLTDEIDQIELLQGETLLDAFDKIYKKVGRDNLNYYLTEAINKKSNFTANEVVYLEEQKPTKPPVQQPVQQQPQEGFITISTPRIGLSRPGATPSAAQPTPSAPVAPSAPVEKPGTKEKIITLEAKKAMLKSLEDSGQVTKKCD